MEADISDLPKKTGKAFSDLITRFNGHPILLLLSGGSAFDILPFVRLPDECGELSVSVLDERVTADEEERNFSALQKTDFFRTFMQKGGDALKIPQEGNETVQEVGGHMDAVLKAWRKENPGGKIIATLGMGADGHTAGIMPFPENSARFAELFEDEARFAVGYDASGKTRIPLRTTVTLPFLREHVDGSIAYAVGEEKRAALEKAFAETGSLAETPARIFQEMKGVKLFTDSEPMPGQAIQE